MQSEIVSLITPAMAMVFTLVFLALWWKNRQQLEILAYSFSYATLAIGFVLSSHLLERPAPWEWAIIQAVSAFGIVAIVWGLARRSGIKAPMLACWIVAIAGTLFVWEAALLQAPTALILAHNLTAGILFLMGAMTLWQAGLRGTMERSIVALMVLMACNGFMKPVFVIFAEGDLGGIFYGSSVFLSVNVVLVGLLAMLLALALIGTVMMDRFSAQHEEAATDELSGLRIRRVFEQEAKAMMVKAPRKGAALSLIVADIDHFKKVNDTWGHAAGDKVIAAFGKLLRTAIRSRDLVGRLGGEEFAIILWGCDETAARSMAERIRLEVPSVGESISRRKLNCTASFGIAEIHPGDTYSNAFKRADEALYRAKESGRDKVCGSEDDDPEDTPSNVVAIPSIG